MIRFLIVCGAGAVGLTSSFNYETTALFQTNAVRLCLARRMT